MATKIYLKKISYILQKNYTLKVSFTLEWNLIWPTTQTPLKSSLNFIKKRHTCLKYFLNYRIDADLAIKLYPLIFWDDC